LIHLTFLKECEVNLKKDILTLLELSREDFEDLFKRALELKKRHREGIADTPLAGKTLGLIFDKPSTRTRISFEAAMIQLGGTPVFISTKDTQLSRNEPVRDTARVLSGYLDAIAVRTYSQDIIKEYAEFADIPVINALTDLYHPCQVLSDLLTVIEQKKNLEKLKFAWVGDSNNVANSWINAAAVLGINLVLACPEGYPFDENILDIIKEKNCKNIILTHDPEEAVKDADVIYTDVWTSMGKEEQKDKAEAFNGFQVDKVLVEKASKDVMVMHCLPAHRGEEISEEVLEGPNSVVWKQSENKMHMAKAILEKLIG